MTRLAYIHTVTSLPANFNALSDELIPEVDRFHIVDESLLQATIRSGGLSELTMRRLSAYLVSAEQAGADLIMVTCSTLGPAVEVGRDSVQIPVLRVDQAMADQAVATGGRIGVAATLSTTLVPTTDLIQARATAAGQQVEIVPCLCEGAFEAVTSGDADRHDELVKTGLQELLSADVDVIVLAQASMARAVSALPQEEVAIPILTSPRLAVEHLAQLIPTL
jgi:Asp/Glu/hydantoin racemase